MLTPLGSELAHERDCDRRSNAVPRHLGPGRVRTAVGLALIGAGSRLTRTAPERPGAIARRVS